MGDHIDDEGRFQSDKYPWCRPDFVPLKVTDPMAQPVLWAYAQARRSVDAAFADDLERRLREVGYCPELPEPERIVRLDATAHRFVPSGNDVGVTMAHVRMCQETLASRHVPPGDDGLYVFLFFASEADRKAHEDARRARGEAMPKGWVIV